MQFIDLKAQQDIIKDDVQQRISEVLRHGRYIMGPEVTELEELLADYVGVKHCIAVSSGTDALLIALMALDIGRGDEVITSPFSFIATSEVIHLTGAKAHYIDIQADTYNLDPVLLRPAINQNTKAILPVSLYGQCADYDEINALAAEYGIPVIEDAAQSFGATYKGKKSCALTSIACTSFFPSKPLGGYGDGGACFTDDDQLATKMRQIRLHGQNGRYNHVRLGINGRIDTLQAAILLAKFPQFVNQEIAARETIGRRYSEQLADLDCITPTIRPANRSVYAQYTIQVKQRDQLIDTLTQQGIPTAVHYPVPLHLQPVFREAAVSSTETYSVSETAASQVLSLPMHPYLSEQDQDQVIEAIRTALSNVA